MVRTGPDGALWVADMYRYMIEHPDWLPANGKEELLPHYRLGDDKGRIYRIVPENLTQRRHGRSLTPRGDARGCHDSTNDWQRDKAQQQLLWNLSRSAVPLLEKLAGTSQIPEARAQALATLSAMRALSTTSLISALQDPVAGCARLRCSCREVPRRVGVNCSHRARHRQRYESMPATGASLGQFETQPPAKR